MNRDDFRKLLFQSIAGQLGIPPRIIKGSSAPSNYTGAGGYRTFRRSGSNQSSSGAPSMQALINTARRFRDEVSQVPTVYVTTVDVLEELKKRADVVTDGSGLPHKLGGVRIEAFTTQADVSHRCLELKDLGERPVAIVR